MVCSGLCGLRCKTPRPSRQLGCIHPHQRPNRRPLPLGQQHRRQPLPKPIYCPVMAAKDVLPSHSKAGAANTPPHTNIGPTNSNTRSSEPEKFHPPYTERCGLPHRQRNSGPGFGDVPAECTHHAEESSAAEYADVVVAADFTPCYPETGEGL